jgi:predicted metal-dependent phosphoesterase TrpH
MMKVDFHVHSKYSIDTLTEPRLIAEKAAKLGMVFACTDHNAIGGHAEYRKIGARFIPGEEVSTDAGDVIGLYLNELIPKKTPFPETIDRIHGQGGLVYLPHMFDISRDGVGNHPDAKRADIIEAFNARCLVAGFNEKALAFAEKNKKPAAAGSDSHTLWEFGRTYTELPDFDIESPKALLRALAKARMVGVRAPFYARGLGKMTMFWKKLALRANKK